MSFVNGDPTRLDELVGFVTTTVKPAMDRLPGSVGLRMWVDRGSGACALLSVWTDEDAMIASEAAALELRTEAAAIVRGVTTVERYESLLVDEFRQHRAGNVMRMMRMHAHPDDVEWHAAWTRETIVPVLRRVPGYLSYVVAVHRATGRAIAMSTYADRTDAEIAYATTAPLRATAMSRGITIDGLRQYDVVVPAHDESPPRTVTLPTEAPV